jgi:hypothetical protein
MRTYISGKITGLSLVEAERLFQQAEDSLTGEVVNPMKLPAQLNWTDYMVADIAELLTCTHVFMLDNWMDSKGARVEHAIARSMGLVIQYQSPSTATRILLDRVPDASMLKGRCTGETTRAVDAAVQTLMQTGVVTVEDIDAYALLYTRVRREHSHLLDISFDRDALTARLVAPAVPSSVTHDRLLAAARELPITATGEEIAARAGEARTSINYHFGSVAELKRLAGSV